MSHEAAALSGDVVEVSFELTEIDRRKLVFTTTVTGGGKTLSRGSHQRFVVKPG